MLNSSAVSSSKITMVEVVFAGFSVAGEPAPPVGFDSVTVNVSSVSAVVSQ